MIENKTKYQPPDQIFKEINIEKNISNDNEEENQKKQKKNKKQKQVEDEDENSDSFEEIDQNDKYDIKKALHPIAVIFTLLFKGLAVATYFFGGLFFSDVMIFIIIVLLNSFDFWTVKNVTGRLLVGLRWWSDFNDEGVEEWRFESFDKKFEANLVDKSFFWTSQFASTVFWAIFLVFKIISLNLYWGILTFIGFLLSAVNLYCYYKCSKEYQGKLKNMKGNILKHGIMHMINKK
ncbi:hypothetical protein IMG5_015500 [Ichthyophthirius multifiliis]|uniref:Golgi apparatus membrane protein TVP23 homolog n=1 Tax=Ichthyophthirius multifiliis TaxID=5932 RepID=G0QKB3_ICHMU|nr:hypothetical protein IMG5_015500 [Ichthyophthirius multifiliis]EGR34343.1 hypothetical protein IMG5_015500 [Ichthyophthirius multifiliis]|eukprot:XP_004039647.1 hypothetical protein IMG5_015500 [Ichthyophthirius multifiliis]